jgi:hypothetical protein
LISGSAVSKICIELYLKVVPPSEAEIKYLVHFDLVQV